MKNFTKFALLFFCLLNFSLIAYGQGAVQFKSHPVMGGSFEVTNLNPNSIYPVTLTIVDNQPKPQTYLIEVPSYQASFGVVLPGHPYKKNKVISYTLSDVSTANGVKLPIDGTKKTALAPIETIYNITQTNTNCGTIISFKNPKPTSKYYWGYVLPNGEVKYDYSNFNNPLANELLVNQKGEYFLVEVSQGLVFLTSSTVKVNVNASITAPAIPTLNQQGAVTLNCDSNSVFLKVNGTYDFYQWYRDGVAINGATGNSIQATGGVAINEQVIYTVKVANAGSSCYSMNSEGVAVTKVKSEPPVLLGPALITLPMGSSYTLTSKLITGSLQWYRNGVAIDGTNGLTYNVTLPGVYTAKVTTNGSCYSDFSNAVQVQFIDTLPQQIVQGCKGTTQWLNSSISTYDSILWVRTGGQIMSVTNKCLIYLFAQDTIMVTSYHPTGIKIQKFIIQPYPTVVDPTIVGGMYTCSINEYHASVGNYTPGYTYTWSVNGVAQSPTNGNSFNAYFNSDNTLLTLIGNSPQGCESNLYKKYVGVEVIPSPDAQTGIIPSICAKTPNTLSYSGNTKPGTVLYWYESPTATSTSYVGQNIVFTESQNIAYTKKFYLAQVNIGPGGNIQCESPRTEYSFEVKPTPTLAYSFEKNAVCEGTVNTLTLNGASTYTVDLNPIVGNEITFSSSVLKPSFNVTGISEFGCSDSMQISTPAMLAKYNAPSFNEFSVCAETFVNLIPNESDGNYNYYDANMNLVAYNYFHHQPFTTKIDSNTTFYAQRVGFETSLQNCPSDLTAITVNAIENHKLELGDDLSFCGAQVFSLGSNKKINNVVYNWYENGNLISNDHFIFISSSPSTKYKLTTANVNGSCFYEDSILVTVNPLPDSTKVNFSPENRTLCASEVLTIAVSTPNYLTIDYDVIAPPLDSSYTVNGKGSYQGYYMNYKLKESGIMYFVTTDKATGCSTSVPYVITVKPSPEVPEIQTTTTLTGGNVKIDLLPKPGEFYHWYDGTTNNYLKKGISFTTTETMLDNASFFKSFYAMAFKGDCSDKSEVVNVKFLPKFTPELVGVDFDLNQPVCNNSNVTFQINETHLNEKLDYQSLELSGHVVQGTFKNKLAGGNFIIDFWFSTLINGGTGGSWKNGPKILYANDSGTSNGDLGFSILDGKIAFGIGNTTTISNVKINDGQFHSICLYVQSNGVAQMWIDGKSQATSSGFATSSIVGNKVIKLGSSNNGNLIGFIDEICIVNVYNNFYYNQISFDKVKYPFSGLTDYFPINEFAGKYSKNKIDLYNNLILASNTKFSSLGAPLRMNHYINTAPVLSSASGTIYFQNGTSISLSKPIQRINCSGVYINGGAKQNQMVNFPWFSVYASSWNGDSYTVQVTVKLDQNLSNYGTILESPDCNIHLYNDKIEIQSLETNLSANCPNLYDGNCHEISVVKQLIAYDPGFSYIWTWWPPKYTYKLLVYVDGTILGIKVLERGDDNSVVKPIKIGGYDNFNGYIQDLKVWGLDIGPENIKNFMLQPVSPDFYTSYKGLVAHFDFKDNGQAPQTINNLVSGGNDGYLGSYGYHALWSNSDKALAKLNDPIRSSVKCYNTDRQISNKPYSPIILQHNINIDSLNQVAQEKAKQMETQGETNNSVEPAMQFNLDFYPNPFHGQATLSIESSESTAIVKIMDVNGKVLYMENLSTMNKHQINVDFESGTYVLQVQTSSEQKSIPIILVR